VIGSGSDAAAAESAAREAQVLNQLRHPHIVPLRSDES
jgi:serine/threonine protein kinase